MRLPLSLPNAFSTIGCLAQSPCDSLVATCARFPPEPIRQFMKLLRLNDGERLMSLFEMAELGLKPKTVYELVPEFFRSFER